ncbi:MAG: L,D-transpeptidase [Anaerolineaceae bacterium]
MKIDSSPISRRNFLKLMGVGALAFALPKPENKAVRAQRETPQLGRVAGYWISVFPEPSDQARATYSLKHDQVVKLLESVEVEDKNGDKSLWYKLAENEYVYSGYIQPVKNIRNVSSQPIPEKGCLGEVTVPKIEYYREPRKERLYTKYYSYYYYSCTFWVLNRVYDEWGVPWYELMDDVNGSSRYVRAYAIRLVTAEELTPISPEVPLDKKRIQLDLKNQLVTAYEYDKQVFSARVSTGYYTGSTPLGTYMTTRKRPCRRMVNIIGDANTDYDLPGVPWVSYFTDSGVAFHGAYWHSRWGHRMSNGCVNMPAEDAKWIYRWCDPRVPFDEYFYEKDKGTRVDVIMGT